MSIKQLVSMIYNYFPTLKIIWNPINPLATKNSRMGGSTQITQVLHVPVEDRNLDHSNEFGQANKQVNIPKEYHRWILGKQGQRLMELDKTTAFKIRIPSVQEQSDIITITGINVGIEEAEHEIKVISEKQNAMIAKTSAHINIPPPSVENDEITITCEKEAGLAAKKKIETIFCKAMVHNKCE